MRTCVSCGESKEPDQFVRRGKGYRPDCKQCKRAYNKRDYRERNEYHRDRIDALKKVYRAANIALVVDRFAAGCVDCGEMDALVLEFDHLNDKTFTVSGKFNSKSPETMKAELDKCEVVCANCHRRRTYKRSPNWRTKIHTRVGDVGKPVWP